MALLNSTEGWVDMAYADPENPDVKLFDLPPKDNQSLLTVKCSAVLPAAPQVRCVPRRR
jgi:hypothetical protein